MLITFSSKIIHVDLPFSDLLQFCLNLSGLLAMEITFYVFVSFLGGGETCWETISSHSLMHHSFDSHFLSIYYRSALGLGHDMFIHRIWI